MTRLVLVDRDSLQQDIDDPGRLPRPFRIPLLMENG